MRKEFGRKKRVLLVLTFFVSLLLGAAGNLSTIFQEAKVKYKNFNQKIQDITIVKETKIIGGEKTISSESKVFKKGKKFRIENTMNMPQASDMPGSMKTIIIYDGTDTWMISPFRGKIKLSREQSKKYQSNDEQNWWTTTPEDAKSIGTERVGKRKCYVIKFKDKKRTSFNKIWVDKKYLTLVKAEGKTEDGKTMLWLNSDFRNIKGKWIMPYKTEVYADGELFTTSVVKSLEINKGLSDELFDADKLKAPQGSNIQEMMKKAMEQDGK